MITHRSGPKSRAVGPIPVVRIGDLVLRRVHPRPSLHFFIQGSVLPWVVSTECVDLSKTSVSGSCFRRTTSSSSDETVRVYGTLSRQTLFSITVGYNRYCPRSDFVGGFPMETRLYPGWVLIVGLIVVIHYRVSVCRDPLTSVSFTFPDPLQGLSEQPRRNSKCRNYKFDDPRSLSVERVVGTCRAVGHET